MRFGERVAWAGYDQSKKEEGRVPRAGILIGGLDRMGGSGLMPLVVR